MKKSYIFMSMIASLVLGLAACSDAPEGVDDEQTPPATDTPSGETAAKGYLVELRARLNDGSRASFDETDLKTLNWESDDALGMFIHEEVVDGDEKHVANNVRMGFVGTPESALFEGTIFSNPETRASDWDVFAYFPYNSSAVDRNVYHESSWLVKHASRQTQIDANHTNYDKYAFFSSNNNVWAVGEDCPTVTLVDRTSALRFLIKADASAPAGLGAENLEEVDIFVTKKSTFEEKGIKLISASDGVRPLSGHFSFNHETGAYTPIEGEARNYIEVDFFGASTRGEEPFEIKITADNDIYVWAVVPPFTLADDELLVAEFNTASYKVVYAYDRAGDFNFEANTLYNFKNVAAIGGLGEDCNIVSNDPVIHTNDYILGESAEATLVGIDNQQIKYRYPLNMNLTMTIDLPIDPAYVEEGAMEYYIRYGYCDFCGADGGANHNGLDVPYSDVVEAQVTWVHETDPGYDVSNYVAVPVTDDEGHEFGIYRLSYHNVVDDVEFLKEAFNGMHDPIYQAYAVYKAGTAEQQVFYGHVVHVDMDPFVSDFNENSYSSSFAETPIILQGTQFYLNVPDAYFFNGTAPAPYYWVNTISSLRVYRCDISASVNGDGSLKTATLEEAVTLNSATTEMLPRLQTINAQGGYTGFYTDINTNGNGFIRYRENGGDRYDLATTDFDDYNGAYCYVMQAYDKKTMELVWIRSEYFRLCDVKAASAN